MGQLASEAGRKILAVGILVVAAYILFKVVISAVAAVVWIAVVILAVVGVLWAIATLR